MTTIHPTAYVHPGARLGENVRLGPFCVIEEGVEIGAGCTLESHVVIKAESRLGPDNRICDAVVIGGLPQHRRAIPRAGRVEIGRGNVLREHVTVHRAIQPDATTRIGNDNLLMVGTHIAHDCVIGDQTILANNVLLAGHVTVADHAYLSGAVAVHQFCRIGRHAMVGGQAHITRDVPPFVTVDGQSSRIVGINTIGLRRSGVSTRELALLKAAYRIIYREGLSWDDMLAVLDRDHGTGVAAAFVVFLRECRRGIMQERRPSATRATVRIATTDKPAERGGAADRRVA